MPAIVSILMEISCLFTVSLLIIMFVIFMANKTCCLSVCLSLPERLEFFSFSCVSQRNNCETKVNNFFTNNSKHNSFVSEGDVIFAG